MFLWVMKALPRREYSAILERRVVQERKGDLARPIEVSDQGSMGSRGERREVSREELFLFVTEEKVIGTQQAPDATGHRDGARRHTRRNRMGQKGENRVSDNPMFLYAGEYDSVEDAEADLEDLKELHQMDFVGT
jgi:hypothetical protein